MQKNGLTIIVGAGASIKAGSPGVDALTKAVLNSRSPRIIADFPDYLTWPPEQSSPQTVPLAARPSLPVISLLRRGIELGESPVTFETVLHAIETLETYAAATTYAQELRDVRPLIAAFTDPSPRFRALFNYLLLLQMRHEAVALIRDAIICGGAQRSESYVRQSEAFIGAMSERFRLSVQNLNYDEHWEIGHKWVDGFVAADGGFGHFDRREFVRAMNAGDDIMCHLHGSVLFGYPAADFQAAPYASGHRTLVKYASSEGASKSLSMLRSPAYTDNVVDEEAPIISGAQKVLKLGSAPYAYYYSALQRAVQENSRLLFVGYGFNDPHINRWAIEAVQMHGPKLTKIAIVDYKPSEALWSISANPTVNELVSRLGEAKNMFDEHARELSISGNIAISGWGYPLRSDLTNALIKWME